MESSLQSRLSPGLTIKIQRSNGLIHSATVGRVDLERSCVFVEWTEGGTAKGKEIDFEDVAAINPELLQLPPLYPKDNLPLQENVTVQKQKRRSVNSKIPAPKEGLRSRSTRMLAIPEARAPAQENDMEIELPASTNSRKQFPAAVRRKSCIVREMEKMKNKREEKKAQNSEMRIKRAQEYDNSFPNWEFARMIKEFRATLDCRPLTMTDPVEEHRICVCVRKRPLNKHELTRKEIDVISIPNKCLLLVHEPKLKVDLTKYLENQTFYFDFAFDETASNDVVYRFTARPLVQTIFEGGKATCFAYGQTGSGKTHTMVGDLAGKSQNASKGIYAMASQDVFLLKNQPRYRNLGLEVYVTFFEIYNGKLFDLLNKKAKLRVLEDGKQQVQVVGLQEHLVNCAEDVIKMIDMGSACRTSGQTFANSNSSRSHACFQILLRTKERMHGKFSLVDLAGNERGVDTSSTDWQTRVEGAEINKSLLALKECIRALGQNKAHTPFRESKLTQVLRDSFIGENSRTCMISMISPGISSCEYTLNTLRYADRVKELSPHIGPSGEQPMQMETDETEASSAGALATNSFSKEEEELSSQMSSFNETMTQIRELEERAVEELKEIAQLGPGWLELSVMTEQPDYDLEVFVTRAESALAQQAKHFAALQEVLKALRLAMHQEEQVSKQTRSKKRPQ
ncbi:PREDICTED: kinesin-like protein KIF2C isoform X4 [Chinchilla lanigera]|uniref:kinesin-like protein KIF2C isoform X4 n=1 Tax=Chinchilla lanigera TaxID=34839 RepID=UPI0006977FA6|nr:PREDICTED: kinesin-like protein KIF2C isoform X4 [Chinchilla lanigera]